MTPCVLCHSRRQTDLYSGALFIQVCLGWNLYLSTVLMLVVTALYTIAGKVIEAAGTLRTGVFSVRKCHRMIKGERRGSFWSQYFYNLSSWERTRHGEISKGATESLSKIKTLPKYDGQATDTKTKPRRAKMRHDRLHLQNSQHMALACRMK